MKSIPIKPFVAIADPSTTIKVEGDEEEIAKVVAHAAELPRLIMDIDHKIGKGGAKKLPSNQIGKIITRECGDFNIDMEKHYGIQPADILPGVICPECGRSGMSRNYNGWVCSKCSFFSKNAHHQAFVDYFLLIKGTITNSECRHFLGYPSRGTTTRLLKNSGLSYDKKDRYWRKKS